MADVVDVVDGATNLIWVPDKQHIWRLTKLLTTFLGTEDNVMYVEVSQHTGRLAGWQEVARLQANFLLRFEKLKYLLACLNVLVC